MKKRSKPPARAGALIGDFLRKSGHSNLLDFAKIIDAWPDIVGRELARVSCPAELKRRALTVWATEPVWIDSMMYVKKEILEKTNAVFGKPMVDSIIIVHGSFDAPETREEEDYLSGPPPEIPEEEIKEVVSALDQIPDSQLRSAVKRVILKDMVIKFRRPAGDKE